MEYAVASYLNNNSGSTENLNLETIGEYFSADNIEYVKNNTEYKIKKKGTNSQILCDVAISNGSIIVDCGEYASTKTIPYEMVNTTIDNTGGQDSNDYVSESGSTIIRLKPSFTQTLATLDHEIEIVSADGKATSDFDVIDGISFTIEGVGTYHTVEGTTWGEWILSYGISSGDNGIVWVQPNTLELYVDIGNGLWMNDIRNQHYGDVIESTTYRVGGPVN